jgi:hypothetical protein
LDPAGKPTSGTVVAYVTPSGGATVAASAKTRDLMIPIAKTTAGADGTFVLRAAFDSSYGSFAARSGSLDLLLNASSDGAIGFQTRTVWWQAPTDTEAGLWSIQDPALGLPPIQAETASQIAPNDLQLEPMTAAASTSTGLASRVSLGGAQARASVSPPGSCFFDSSRAGPDTKSYIGQLYLKQVPYWQGKFEYEQTSTTSFQTGWAVAGGGAFNASGSQTFTSSHAFGGLVTLPSNTNSDTGRKYWITLHSIIGKYHCWNGTGPPPTNPNSWPVYYTFRTTDWARDFLVDGDAMPNCNTGVQANQFGVAPGTEVHRNDGSATTIADSQTGTVNIDAYSIPFSLSTTVTNTWSSGSTAVYRWRNTSTSAKSLCGVSGPVNGNTRVVAE